MKEKSEPVKAEENSAHTTTGTPPEASSNPQSISMSTEGLKKFPPDHPCYFAWDATERDKGKHLIFVGMGINRKKVKGEKTPSSTNEPKPLKTKIHNSGGRTGPIPDGPTSTAELGRT